MKNNYITVCMVATLFAVMLSFQFTFAQQTTIITEFPAAAANIQTQPAGKLWTNPQNVRALNNGAAAVSLARNGICNATKCYRSAMIQADHFGFNLTTNDSIVGIEATVRLKASAANSVKELGVQVAFWNNVVGIPVNKASNTFWPTQYQLRNFGGQNDTWGIACCLQEPGNIICCDQGGNTIIANDFGLRISVQNLNASIAPKATIDYVKMTIYYTASSGTRIERQTRKAGNISEAWQIYPNPVGDILKLKSYSDVFNAMVKVFDMQGRQVLKINIGFLNRNESFEIDTALLPKGVYLLQLLSDGNVVAKRFVKE